MMLTRTVPAFAAATLALLAACTPFPDLATAESPGVAQAPYPRLLTTAELPPPAAANAIAVEDSMRVTLRADGLRGRAGRVETVRVGADADLPSRLAALRRRAEELRAQP